MNELEMCTTVKKAKMKQTAEKQRFLSIIRLKNLMKRNEHRRSPRDWNRFHLH